MIPTKPRITKWIAGSVLLVVAGAALAFGLRRSDDKKAIAAYILPLDAGGRVKLGYWHAKALSVPLSISSGQSVNFPAGIKVGIVRSGSSQSETVSGPAKLVFNEPLPSETKALVSPLKELVADTAAAAKAPAHFVVTSPVGKTRYLNPLLDWTAREGVSYDVAVLDPSDPYVPPRVKTNIRPPIALADLETPQRRQLGADRNYEVVVRETGSPTILGGGRFLTSDDAKLEDQLPTAAHDLVLEAVAAMAKKPYRLGDAWLALSRLPADWAKSELAVRLRLQVASELGLSDELARTLEDAKRLP